jgi:septal ring factor EnvC (AmiA/AmiB activator)
MDMESLCLPAACPTDKEHRPFKHMEPPCQCRVCKRAGVDTHTSNGVKSSETAKEVVPEAAPQQNKGPDVQPRPPRITEADLILQTQHAAAVALQQRQAVALQQQAAVTLQKQRAMALKQQQQVMSLPRQQARQQQQLQQQLMEQQAMAVQQQQQAVARQQQAAVALQKQNLAPYLSSGVRSRAANEHKATEPSKTPAKDEDAASGEQHQVQHGHYQRPNRPTSDLYGLPHSSDEHTLAGKVAKFQQAMRADPTTSGEQGRMWRMPSGCRPVSKRSPDTPAPDVPESTPEQADEVLARTRKEANESATYTSAFHRWTKGFGGASPSPSPQTSFRSAVPLPCPFDGRRSTQLPSMAEPLWPLSTTLPPLGPQAAVQTVADSTQKEMRDAPPRVGLSWFEGAAPDSPWGIAARRLNRETSHIDPESIDEMMLDDLSRRADEALKEAKASLQTPVPAVGNTDKDAGEASKETTIPDPIIPDYARASELESRDHQILLLRADVKAAADRENVLNRRIAAQTEIEGGLLEHLRVMDAKLKEMEAREKEMIATQKQLRAELEEKEAKKTKEEARQEEIRSRKEKLDEMLREEYRARCAELDAARMELQKEKERGARMMLPTPSEPVVLAPNDWMEFEKRRKEEHVKKMTAPAWLREQQARDAEMRQSCLSSVNLSVGGGCNVKRQAHKESRKRAGMELEL